MIRIAVDTSVFLAILNAEPDWRQLDKVLVRTEPCMSCATRVELEQVVRARFGERGAEEATALLKVLRVTLVPFDEDQVYQAAIGAARYGRGASPMILNMGDLFSYALAKAWDLPLLFKGDDFGRTDVRAAMDEPAIRALAEV